MLRLSSSPLVLSVFSLCLASFTFACSGASSGNSDVDSSTLAVQKKKDGRPTGDGKTCSWGDVPTTTTPVPSTPPSTGGGSSGGCATDESGNYRCWSYDAEGREVDIKPSGSSTSSTSSSSGGSSSGSSGGCSVDEKGNTTCWSYPTPDPLPEPTPVPPSPPAADIYQLGDWFPSPDGCNKCTCTDIGIMCTVQVCQTPPPPPPVKGCDLGGKWMEAGTSYFDGCNTCSCGADGMVACTARACQDPIPTPPPSKGCEVDGKWIESGTSFSDGCNTCSCGADGMVACTKMACDDPAPPAPKK